MTQRHLRVTWGRLLRLTLSVTALISCEEPDFNSLLEPVEAGVSSAGAMSEGGSSSTGVSVTADVSMSAGTPAPAGVTGVSGGASSGGVALGGAERGGEEAGGATLGPQPLITGRWESVGTDVAPLLRDPSVGLTRLEATFLSDLRFIVEVDNQDGYHFELEGSYELREAPSEDLAREGAVHEITLRQTSPDVAVSQGIWRVEGDTLQYEVVQVEPPLPGAQTPPGREGGFGSTNNGALGTDNIQLYRRLR